MNPVSPLPAIAILSIALLTAWLIGLKAGFPKDTGRVSTIDGLRGYLAVLVLIHHSSFWYGWLRWQQWRSPPSSLYGYFGAGSVCVFFMITAFLAFSKLFRCVEQNQRVDFLQMQSARALRLAPLYLLAVGLMLVVVAALSHFELRESAPALLQHVGTWLPLGLLGNGWGINGVAETWLVTAGVIWYMQYEWLFHLALPLFAAPLARLANLLVAALAVYAFVHWKLDWNRLWPFAGGLLAALLVRTTWFPKFAKHWSASLLLIALVVATVERFPYAYQFKPIALLSLAFCLIAGGNSLFGAFTHKVPRLLGETSYGVYLLHGLALFTTWTFIVGRDNARAFTPLQHWTTVAVVAPVVILVAWLAQRHIEKPVIQVGDKLLAKLFKK